LAGSSPGFNGINDHVASGIRLGMDAVPVHRRRRQRQFLTEFGKDGTTIQLHAAGVIRIRPDGTGLEVVSNRRANPLSVALTARMRSSRTATTTR